MKEQGIRRRSRHFPSIYLILSKTKYIQPKLRAQTRGRAAGINGSRRSQGSQINPTLGPI